jgi:hypothetical protein
MAKVVKFYIIYILPQLKNKHLGRWFLQEQSVCTDSVNNYIFHGTVRHGLTDICQVKKGEKLGCHELDIQ